MFVRRRRWNSLKLLLSFLFQHPQAFALRTQIVSDMANFTTCRKGGCKELGQLPVGRPPCKSFVKGEKDSPDARLGGARTIEAIRTRSSHVCLSAVVSCLRRTGHPFTVSGPCGPSQKIECVFSASPETIR